MKLDYDVLLGCWALGVALVYFLVPRKQIRVFVIAFLVCQTLAWLNSALLNHYQLVEFPVREFPKAMDIGFTMQFLVYPVLAGVFIVYEPKASWLMRGFYLAVWSLVIMLFHVGLNRFTNLVAYKHVHWMGTWLISAVILAVVSGVVRWFFREEVILIPKRAGRSR